MSDYLGVLAARYLNPSGSIRPEPVSMYQAPPADWQLAVDAEVESPITTPSEEPSLISSAAEGAALIVVASGEGASIPSPAGGAQDGGPGPLLPAPSEPSSTHPATGGVSFTPSTIGGATFARSPSGEESTAPRPSGRAASMPSPSIDRGDLDTVTRPLSANVGHASSSPTRRAPPVSPASLAEAPSRSPSGAVTRAGVEIPQQEPVQPPHSIGAPRVAPSESRRAPSRALSGTTNRPIAPLPEAADPPVPSFAPHSTTLPLIREGKTEPPPLRVAPSLTLPHVGPGRREARAPTVPSPRASGNIVAATGSETYTEAQPIVEISIDEINIRAAPPPPPAAPRRDRLVRPPMSLDDYLRRRAAGGGR